MLHYFWTISPVSHHRGLCSVGSHCPTVFWKCSWGYLWGIRAMWRDDSGDGAFEPSARLPQQPGAAGRGGSSHSPTLCPRAGANGCSLAQQPGPLTGDGYRKGTPNQRVPCHGCPRNSLACSRGYAFYIMLLRLRYNFLLSPSPAISLDCQCL